MKRLLGIFLIAVAFMFVLGTGCSEPKECKELKEQVCDFCGKDSKACENIKGKTDTAENCKEAQGAIKTAEDLVKVGGDDAKKAFCDELAKD